MKIAFVYDRVNKFGGAERVLLALRTQFPNSVLFTSVYDDQSASWVGDWEVRTSFLQRIPFAKNHHEWFGWLMPLAFETLDFSGFDVIISVTSEAAKGIITNPNQIHICYCLTPTRYLWSHTHEYEKGNFGWVKRLFFTKLREWDYIAGQRPDKMIAISEHVAKRIHKYYKREVDHIISPPVNVVKKEMERARSQDYFLIVSRLVPYKRVDLAIQSCLKANQKLVIVGTGNDEARLRTIAQGSDLIAFTGFVSEADLGSYYQSAKALLCPQEEDFGIVSVEAQSFGIPVISYSDSGVAETIIPKKTGLLFTQQTVSSLEQALLEYEQMSWDHTQIRESISRFDERHFKNAFAKVVSDAVV
ncbi:MAG: glycosyltransferase [Candidatus Woesebacteria bacterium]